MFAKIRTSIFIDALYFETSSLSGNLLKAVLKDDKGSVCSTVEKDIASVKEQFTWTGLNDLPYGHYTLELSQGDEEMKLKLVKRV